MYLPSHVLIQKHDKYLSFDIVSKDINWSIYHIHPYAVVPVSWGGKKALDSCSRVRLEDFRWLYFLGVPDLRCACHLTVSLPPEGFSSWVLEA